MTPLVNFFSSNSLLVRPRNDYIYICRKRLEDVSRYRSKLVSSTESNEENDARGNSSSQQTAKGAAAPVVA
jgi:hypothetical protein